MIAGNGMFAPIRSVLVLHKSPAEIQARLEARFPAIDFEWVDDLDAVQETLRTTEPDAVFSIAQAGFRGDAHRIAAAYETVRWVHCGGSGYDHLLPLDFRRKVLTNCAGVLAPYLAETVAGAILALNGNLLGYVSQQKERRWKPIPFRPLSEQSLLVVGLGAIGSAVAAKASALGLAVVGVSRSGKPSLPMIDQVHLSELRSVIGSADFLSIHLSLTGETRHLIDAGMIAAMKPGAVLINTSRGAIIDQDALFQSLSSSHLRAAYLDVFREEPLPASSPLWGLDNLIITPHCADAIIGWAGKYGDLFCENLDRWNSRQPIINAVMPTT